jgi:hypothetical protein
MFYMRLKHFGPSLAGVASHKLDPLDSTRRNTMTDFCTVGEKLVENVHLAEVSAWKNSLSGLDASTRKTPLLSAEKALLTHSKECTCCNSAVYQHYLQ